MAIESALIPVCLPLIQFSLKQPERFVQRNRTKIIKNVSALRLGLRHTRFRSAFDDPPIIEQMRFFVPHRRGHSRGHPPLGYPLGPSLARERRARKIPKMGVDGANLTFWSTMIISNSYSAYMIGYGTLEMRVHWARFPKPVTHGLSTASNGESGNRSPRG